MSMDAIRPFFEEQCLFISRDATDSESRIPEPPRLTYEEAEGHWERVKGLKTGLRYLQLVRALHLSLEAKSEQRRIINHRLPGSDWREFSVQEIGQERHIFFHGTHQLGEGSTKQAFDHALVLQGEHALRAVELISWGEHSRSVDLEQRIAAAMARENPSPNIMPPAMHEIVRETVWNRSVRLFQPMKMDGDLSQIPHRSLSANAMTEIALGMARGVRDMVAKGYYHRDIKEDNFFYRKVDGHWEVRIADFNLSVKADEPDHHIVGAPLYRAPEISYVESLEPLMLRSAYNYSEKSEVYSLGLTMQLMIDPPNAFFEGYDLLKGEVARNVPRIAQGERERLQPIWELTVRMVAKNPDERPTLAEVVRAIEEFHEL